VDPRYHCYARAVDRAGHQTKVPRRPQCPQPAYVSRQRRADGVRHRCQKGRKPGDANASCLQIFLSKDFAHQVSVQGGYLTTTNFWDSSDPSGLTPRGGRGGHLIHKNQIIGCRSFLVREADLPARQEDVSYGHPLRYSSLNNLIMG